jgi:hypothetical protein
VTNAETVEMTGSEAEAQTLAELFPVPDQARQLARFIGAWAVEGTLTVEGNPLKMVGEWIFAPSAAGWGVRASLRAEIEALGAYEEDDLVGYDVETRTFHIYSLTNSGAVHDHVASWASENVLDFEYNGLQGGKPYREVGRVELLAADRMLAESTDFVDGQEASSMEVTLTRRQ